MNFYFLKKKLCYLFKVFYRNKLKEYGLILVIVLEGLIYL